MPTPTIRQCIAQLPGIRWARRLRYDRDVRTGTGWTFWGIFSDYQEALAAAPDNPKMARGYDAPGIADRGRGDYEEIHGFDYPALLWLLRFGGYQSAESPPGCKVVDLGGHLGGKYLAFRELWPLPGMEWVVCETPATVAAANGLSAAARAPGLAFTTDIDTINGAQVLFASGVLAYLEHNLWDVLDGLDTPPPHVILNKVPLSSGADFWTLQNASGMAITPYHVFNRKHFIDQMAARGYRLLDEWTIPERVVRIPFRPQWGTEAGTGLSFTRSTTP